MFYVHHWIPANHLYGTAIQLDAHAHPSIVGHWVDFCQIGVEGWQQLVRNNGVASKFPVTKINLTLYLLYAVPISFVRFFILLSILVFSWQLDSNLISTEMFLRWLCLISSGVTKFTGPSTCRKRNLTSCWVKIQQTICTRFCESIAWHRFWAKE